jgi:hypothetical protein
LGQRDHLGKEVFVSKPSIGRIVHLTLPDGEERPAIITRVINEEKNIVGLHVFWDSADPEPRASPALCYYDHGPEWQRLHWHWPERV